LQYCSEIQATIKSIMPLIIITFTQFIYSNFAIEIAGMKCNSIKLQIYWLSGDLHFPKPVASQQAAFSLNTMHKSNT
jgi:hypothetical protein